MHLRLRFDGRRPRLWHTLLLERLRERPGYTVEVDARPGPDDWPSGGDLLFRLESLIHRLPEGGPASRRTIGVGELRPSSKQSDPVLILDFCGDVEPESGTKVWVLAYDGIPGDAALLASLLDRRSPVATVFEGTRPLVSGRVGTEVPGVALTAFADGLSRSTTLILAALDGFDGLVVPVPQAPPAAAMGPRTLGRRAVKMVAAAVVRRLYHLCYRAPHWRVGWRRTGGLDLVDLRRHPDTGWHDLPDNGLRFYADPFPIEHEGECVLFVEDWVHRDGKAMISAVRFGPKGPLGAPVPVLEEPYHLSYPFVFEREGAFWMIPESCANGSVDLYRATTFPSGWVKTATLLSGVAASDATLLERHGRWWMFATVRHAEADLPLGNGSYSDALHLWSAPDFRGPWRPHDRNPLLIDIAAARPAGRIVSRGDVLFRPVQDCSGGYGAALSLARIDRLDDEGFSQKVETTLEPGPAWPGSRLHTVNAAAGYEFIDGSARAPRFPLIPNRRRGLCP